MDLRLLPFEIRWLHYRKKELEMSNNTQGFRTFDPTLFTEEYASPTRENMPKYLNERIPIWQVIVFDLPPVLMFSITLSHPSGHIGSDLVLLGILLMLMSFPAVVMVPLHLIGLAIHGHAQREEIIEWTRRGWVRTGLEPTEEMVAEAERRNAKMRARYSRSR